MGSSNPFTEISFGISRLEETSSELDSKHVVMTHFSEAKIASTRLKLKKHFSALLDLSEERSNLGVAIELELKLLKTAHFSKPLLILPLFSRKTLFKNAFIEDWPQTFLDFK